jgi:predicted Zn-dependent protease
MKIALSAADQDKASIPVVLAAVDELEKTVTDPYLAVVKAAMLIKAGKSEDAKVEMNRALSAMPDSLHVRISAVSADLLAGDFEGAIPQLERFDKDFPEYLDKYLKYTDGYSAFKKSEAGKAWLDQRKTSKQ